MEKTNRISFFLFGIIFFAVYALTLKIAYMAIEQIISINSVNKALVCYGLIGLLLLILAIFYAIYSLGKESLTLTNMIVLVIFFGVLLLVEFWIQKSENLMINDFNLSRELRFKLLGIKSYLSSGFKILFFVIISLKILKKNE